MATKTITSIFRVAEAESKDVGRAIVRIDPKDLLKVKAEIGDVVKIKNQKSKIKNAALAKVMPAFEEMRDKGIIQMDGILRENTGAGVGEKVNVEKIKVNPASTIVLKPLSSESSFKAEDAEYLAQILDGTPVVKGNKIRATLFGTKFQDFEILDTDPDGAVLIASGTLIKIKGAEKAAKRGVGITYEDIGGLKKEIGKIREMIELPLKYPEVFERLGIEPPKGVLLHGSPGCGKTLIARAVANETDASFFHISGPEIMCVGGDTPLFVNDRLISAEKLYKIVKKNHNHFERIGNRETVVPKRKLLVKSLTPDLKIKDGNIIEGTKLKVEEAYQIEFENGTALVVSSNQPFGVLDEDGGIKWKATKELNTEEFIATATSFNIKENNELEWIDKLDKEKVHIILSKTYAKSSNRVEVTIDELQNLFTKSEFPKVIQGITYWENPANRERAKPIKPVWKLTLQLGRFLGGMLAEGSIAKRMDEVCFANSNPDLKNEFSAHFQNLFGIPKSRIKIKNDKVYVHSYSLSHFLNKGLELPLGKKTKSIRVPSYMFSASKEIVSSFISGLLDGDGTIKFKKNYPCFLIFSKSPSFLKEIQTLLLVKLSIPSKVKEHPTKLGQMYRLEVQTREGRRRFIKYVLPYSRDKRKYQATITTRENMYDEAGEDIIPLAPLLKKIKNKLGLRYEKDIPENSIEPYISGRFPLTRRKLKQIYNLLKKYGDLPELDRIARLLNSNIKLTKIKRIKRIKKPVVLYDFGVERFPNFIGGLPFIVLHNSKFYGESEGRLREVFEQAQSNAPAILVIDEIDAIAPKREEMGGEKQVEKRVVATLLAEMDGLESRGDLIVIGITNIPNTLDPALRRPGRFDREIAVPIPDKNGRKQILEIHTRGMPLAKDVDLDKLAEIAYGFVGADLEALCREAAMSALREIMPEIEFEKEYIPYKKLLGLQVSMDHFREALKEVEPSALREVFIEIPNVKWEDVGGLENIKQILKETIEWPLKYGKLFDHSKTKPPKGILLHGPTGCGKTLIAKAVASECGVNFISVKGPQLLSRWVGESERGVREVFKKAKQAAPTIVFFDEIDALVPKRSGEFGDSGAAQRVVSQFLTELDGIEELKGVVILGATNRLDLIDPALLRAGRFDFLLEVPKPDENTRFQIFKIHTRGKPLAEDVNLKNLAEEAKGLVGSDIENICKKAAMAAIREFVGLSNPSAKDYKKFKITAKHFKKALPTPPSKP